MKQKRRKRPYTESRRSYDFILERQIGRTSERTRKHVQRMCLMVTGLIMFVVVLSFLIISRPGSAEAFDGKELVKDYVCVEIREGDSLWSVAQEYMSKQLPSMNIDMLVNEIEKINGLNQETVLKPGNQIMVPYYKTILEKEL